MVNMDEKTYYRILSDVMKGKLTAGKSDIIYKEKR